jgi:hypothetical protein
MFLGRADEAQALYFNYRGKVIGERRWEEVILADFADLRKAGHTHPLMEMVAAQFAGTEKSSPEASATGAGPAGLSTAP